MCSVQMNRGAECFLRAEARLALHDQTGNQFSLHVVPFSQRRSAPAANVFGSDQLH